MEEEKVSGINNIDENKSNGDMPSDGRSNTLDSEFFVKIEDDAEEVKPLEEPHIDDMLTYEERLIEESKIEKDEEKPTDNAFDGSSVSNGEVVKANIPSWDELFASLTSNADSSSDIDKFVTENKIETVSLEDKVLEENSNELDVDKAPETVDVDIEKVEGSLDENTANMDVEMPDEEKRGFFNFDKKEDISEVEKVPENLGEIGIEKEPETIEIEAEKTEEKIEDIASEISIEEPKEEKHGFFNFGKKEDISEVEKVPENLGEIGIEKEPETIEIEAEKTEEKIEDIASEISIEEPKEEKHGFFNFGKKEDTSEVEKVPENLGEIGIEKEQETIEVETEKVEENAATEISIEEPKEENVDEFSFDSFTRIEPIVEDQPEEEIKEEIEEVVEAKIEEPAEKFVESEIDMFGFDETPTREDIYGKEEIEPEEVEEIVEEVIPEEVAKPKIEEPAEKFVESEIDMFGFDETPTREDIYGKEEIEPEEVLEEKVEESIPDEVAEPVIEEPAEKFVESEVDMFGFDETPTREEAYGKELKENIEDEKEVEIEKVEEEKAPIIEEPKKIIPENPVDLFSFDSVTDPKTIEQNNNDGKTFLDYLKTSENNDSNEAEISVENQEENLVAGLNNEIMQEQNEDQVEHEFAVEVPVVNEEENLVSDLNNEIMQEQNEDQVEQEFAVEVPVENQEENLVADLNNEIIQDQNIDQAEQEIAVEVPAENQEENLVADLNNEIMQEQNEDQVEQEISVEMPLESKEENLVTDLNNEIMQEQNIDQVEQEISVEVPVENQEENLVADLNNEIMQEQNEDQVEQELAPEISLENEEETLVADLNNEIIQDQNIDQAEQEIAVEVPVENQEENLVANLNNEIMQEQNEEQVEQEISVEMPLESKEENLVTDLNNEIMQEQNIDQVEQEISVEVPVENQEENLVANLNNEIMQEQNEEQVEQEIAVEVPVENQEENLVADLNNEIIQEQNIDQAEQEIAAEVPVESEEENLVSDLNNEIIQEQNIDQVEQEIPAEVPVENQEEHAIEEINFFGNKAIEEPEEDNKDAEKQQAFFGFGKTKTIEDIDEQDVKKQADGLEQFASVLNENSNIKTESSPKLIDEIPEILSEEDTAKNVEDKKIKSLEEVLNVEENTENVQGIDNFMEGLNLTANMNPYGEPKFVVESNAPAISEKEDSYKTEIDENNVAEDISQNASNEEQVKEEYSPNENLDLDINNSYKTEIDENNAEENISQNASNEEQVKEEYKPNENLDLEINNSESTPLNNNEIPEFTPQENQEEIQPFNPIESVPFAPDIVQSQVIDLNKNEAVELNIMQGVDIPRPVETEPLVEQVSEEIEDINTNIFTVQDSLDDNANAPMQDVPEEKQLESIVIPADAIDTTEEDGQLFEASSKDEAVDNAKIAKIDPNQPLETAYVPTEVIDSYVQYNTQNSILNEDVNKQDHASMQNIQTENSVFTQPVESNEKLEEIIANNERTIQHCKKRMQIIEASLTTDQLDRHEEYIQLRFTLERCQMEIAKTKLRTKDIDQNVQIPASPSMYEQEVKQENQVIERYETKKQNPVKALFNKMFGSRE